MAVSEIGTGDYKCSHYAQFASHLDAIHFDILYWLLFLLVILMLFCSSWYYGRSMEITDGSPVTSPVYRRQMRKCLVVCGSCAIVSVVAVVMETFALLALQFCDGEDLMMLYWSTWTMLQVGSVIAIFGVMLHIVHSLRGRKHPPWALALGTPVLVVAGLGHFCNSVIHGRFRRARRGRTREKSTTPSGHQSISQTTTLRAQSPAAEVAYNARLLGYTTEGGPILRFAEMPRPFNAKSSAVLGTSSDGDVVICFSQDMSIVNTPELPRPAPTAASGPRAPNSVSFHPQAVQEEEEEAQAQEQGRTQQATTPPLTEKEAVATVSPV